MSNRLVKTTVPGYDKDESTGAVVASDLAGYKQILERRKQAKAQSSLVDEVRALKAEVAVIRTQFIRILEALKG